MLNIMGWWGHDNPRDYIYVSDHDELHKNQNQDKLRWFALQAKLPVRCAYYALKNKDSSPFSPLERW